MADVSEGGEAVARLAARRLAAADGGAPTPLEARARSRGEWREGVSSLHLVHALVGALLHRALLEHVEPSPAWIADTVDLLLNGVLPRP